MWFWTAVLASLALGLSALWMSDSRARRRGHTVRPGRGVYRSVRESRRDAVVVDAVYGLNNTQTTKWTSWYRRNSDNAREIRRDDA